MDKAKQNMDKYRKRMGKEPLKVPAVVIKTGFFWNGIEIALILPTTMNPQKAVEAFVPNISRAVVRSCSPNIADMVQAHLGMAESIRTGAYPLKSEQGGKNAENIQRRLRS